VMNLFPPSTNPAMSTCSILCHFLLQDSLLIESRNDVLFLPISQEPLPPSSWQVSRECLLNE
jgi:hypothetical protein